jgi:predicted amidophosphoribosyltransferase
MKGLSGGLLALDVQQCAEHAFLSAADRCHCLAEYLPGGGYRAGEVNQLILNLKCAPSIAALDARRRHYKQRAISDIASALRAAVDQTSVERTTWIPIPTSRPAADADYDDRLQRILRAAFGHYRLDLRNALYQRQAMPADHGRARRLSAEALSRVIGLDRELLEREPLRERIVLFDDVLTSGKHYKCCECRLRELLAVVPISGLFVARRVLPRRRGCPPPPAHAGTARALIAP